MVVGATLVACEYIFAVKDNGLRIEDYSFDPDYSNDRCPTRYAYMKKCVMLLEHTKVPDPSEFCRQNYFRQERDP